MFLIYLPIWFSSVHGPAFPGCPRLGDHYCWSNGRSVSSADRLCTRCRLEAKQKIRRQPGGLRRRMVEKTNLLGRHQSAGPYTGVSLLMRFVDDEDTRVAAQPCTPIDLRFAPPLLSFSLTPKLAAIVMKINAYFVRDCAWFITGNPVRYVRHHVFENWESVENRNNSTFSRVSEKAAFFSLAISLFLFGKKNFTDQSPRNYFVDPWRAVYECVNDYERP